MNFRPCPLCGVLLDKPRPSVRTTAWSDYCACSDHGRCVAHQMMGVPPSRPSEEAMLVRAEVAAKRRYGKWEATNKAFDEYQTIKEVLNRYTRALEDARIQIHDGANSSSVLRTINEALTGDA